MRSSDPSHKHYSECDDVFLAEAKEISRARQRAFQQAAITQKVGLSGRLGLEAVVLDYDINREPTRFIWQGRLGSLGTSP